MRSTPKTASIAIAGLIALANAGCGAVADKAAEQATEKAIESQTGGDVDVDTEGDGSVSFETDGGSFTVGSDEVPDEWPDDVPLPDDLEVLSSTASDAADGRLVAITATTGSTPEELLADFKGAMADWKISGEVNSTSNGGSMTSAQWERDGRRLNFVATTGTDGESSLTVGHTTIG